MKKRIFIISIIIVFIGGIACGFIKNNTEETIYNISEYVPEAEITDEELRKTIVTLYFNNSENNKLESEARLIDSKELLREPYKVLIGMIIDGPKNNSLETLIPNNVKIISTDLKGNCLTVNLSKEFLEIEKSDPVRISNLIYSIVNTVTELKEVSSVKFLIEGKESNHFSDIGIDLKAEFVRM